MAFYATLITNCPALWMRLYHPYTKGSICSVISTVGILIHKVAIRRGGTTFSYQAYAQNDCDHFPEHFECCLCSNQMQTTAINCKGWFLKTSIVSLHLKVKCKLQSKQMKLNVTTTHSPNTFLLHLFRIFSLPAALNKVYDLLFVHAAQEAIWI